MDGEGKSRTKHMPDSLGCVPANLNAHAAAMSSIGILFKSVPNAKCGFPECKQRDSTLRSSGEPLRDGGNKQTSLQTLTIHAILNFKELKFNLCK